MRWKRMPQHLLRCIGVTRRAAAIDRWPDIWRKARQSTLLARLEIVACVDVARVQARAHTRMHQLAPGQAKFCHATELKQLALGNGLPDGIVSTSPSGIGNPFVRQGEGDWGRADQLTRRGLVVRLFARVGVRDWATAYRRRSEKWRLAPHAACLAYADARTIGYVQGTNVRRLQRRTWLVRPATRKLQVRIGAIVVKQTTGRNSAAVPWCALPLLRVERISGIAMGRRGVGTVTDLFVASRQLWGVRAHQVALCIWDLKCRQIHKVVRGAKGGHLDAGVRQAAPCGTCRARSEELLGSIRQHAVGDIHFAIINACQR
mmetsp:Transcript_18655/g.55734  ORF Transcript_18655/g.55734 Transcript_18655/m.55734 type:complete len:318 (-) Transcript_18655:2091-3044(-)